MKKVLLKDIAERVGVSTALVSYVLNGKQKEMRIGTEVTERILKVAGELNYTPNLIAQGLRKGKTMTLGLIVADIANQFFAQLARIIEDEAGKLGYTVIFASSDENHIKSGKLINTFINHQVDGFILVPAEDSNDQVNLLIENNIPVVLLDRIFPDIQTSYVILDNYNASYNAVSYLIEKGYKRIGIVAYNSQMIHMQERIEGYLGCMRSNELTKHISVHQINMEDIHNEMEKIISNLVVKNKKVDALFFVTNSLTTSGLYCIQKYRIKVPGDLAVMGFDGSEAFDFFYSPISYIKQPVNEMGKEAIRILTDLINHPGNNSYTRLKSQLVQRDSV